jgi:hypothetical protein
MPYQFGAVRWHAEQGVPGHCRRLGEYDLRDVDCTTNPLAPFLDLGSVGVRRRSESFKSSAELL